MKLPHVLLVVAACGGSAPPPKTPTPSPAVDPKPASSPADRKPDPEPMSHAGMTEEDAERFADLLTGEQAMEPSGDISRRPGSELGQQIKDLRDSGASVGTGSGPRGGGAQIGGGTGSAGPAAPSGPSGRVSVAAKSGGDGSTLTPNTVVAKILSAYMPGIKRCYKAQLEKDATARGRLDLAFDVSEGGRAVNPKATFPAQQVGDCVATFMKTWFFPKPKDKAGDGALASFTLTLQLIPE